MNASRRHFAAGRLRATLIQHKTRRCFATEFEGIVKTAGLTGTWAKLRTSSGSDVESRQPGWGAIHLGHSQGPQVTTAHYLDPRIVQANKPMPTEL